MLTLAFAACENPASPENPGHVHQWGQWTRTTAPTCTELGEETRVCALNSSHVERRDVSIDTDAHNWGEWVGTVTCETAGSGTRVCANNQEHIDTDDNVQPLGHNYEWKETTAPTCTDPGVETGTCTRDATHTDTLTGGAALGHSYGAWTVTKAPAPGAVGKETKVCARDSSHTEERLIHFMEMVQISAGTFTMGSYDSQDTGAAPPHSVMLGAFSMGRYEITQEQYEAVMESNPSSFTDEAAGESKDRRPVERVSWYDVLVFCNKLSMMEGLTPAYSISGTHPRF